MGDLHDTGTDMELFPRIPGGRPSFDKGNGVLVLDTKLKLDTVEGPNVVCGDTDSDIAMVEATLKLMCGEDMVRIWKERMGKELQPTPDQIDDEDTDHEDEEHATFRTLQ